MLVAAADLFMLFVGLAHVADFKVRPIKGEVAFLPYANVEIRNISTLLSSKMLLASKKACVILEMGDSELKRTSGNPDSSF